MVDIVEKYNRIKNFESDIQGKYHVYPKGYGGCSGIRSCPMMRAMKGAGIKFNKKVVEKGWIGISDERGGMRTGTMAHEEVQLSLQIDWENNKDTDPEYKDIKYDEEVYVIVPITDKYTAISPIDVLYSKEGAWEYKEIIFRYFKEKMKVITDKSKIEEIYDIKSGGDFAYYKKLVKGNIPDDYLAQFHVYMKGTGKKELKVLAFHKQYGRTKIIEVVWDQNFWEGVIKMQERVDSLTEEYEKREEDLWVEPILTPKDLACLWNDGNIDWYSCPLSITYEEMDGKIPGKPMLRLLKPCEHACKILVRKATAQFVIDTKWQRGNSHVRIMKVPGEVTSDDLARYLTAMNVKKKKAAEKKGYEFVPLKPNKNFSIEEYIQSRNKSGTTFVDTVYYAFKSYEEM